VSSQKGRVSRFCRSALKAFLLRRSFLVVMSGSPLHRPEEPMPEASFQQRNKSRTILIFVALHGRILRSVANLSLTLMAERPKERLDRPRPRARCARRPEERRDGGVGERGYFRRSRSLTSRRHAARDG